MAFWLVRGGRFGEYEETFLTTNRIYLTWGGLFAHEDPTKVKDYAGVKALVARHFAKDSPNKQGHTAGQFSAFVLGMKPGDLIATPRKLKSAVAIGEVAGPCQYNSKAAEPYYVHRDVKWLNKDVPRSAFDQDILYSLGAFMTICEIKRNNAEKRVRAMAKAGWKPGSSKSGKGDQESPEGGDSIQSDGEESMDVERYARDQIVKLIQREYTGHGLARLIGSVLEAQGYTTHVSAEGPDKGVDILAAPGALGFGTPRICVQVKSGDSAVDRPTLDQLIGVMQNFKAEQGLLVSWAGFKSSVDKETANHFFRVRFWDADAVVDQLLANYDKLPAEVRAELPLKRIWTVARQEEEE